MSELTEDKGAPDSGPTLPERPVMLELDLTINGDQYRLTCEPGDTLLTVLRRLGLFSVRFGSGTGESGAAAVLFDGRLVSADVMLAGQASGHEVTTVESLDVATGELDPIQQAFVDIGALQSGYSAGAMVLAAKALIEANPDPSEAEIRDALSGILDRETGYVKVVEAIRRAAAAHRGEKVPPVEPVVLEPLTGPDSTERRVPSAEALQAPLAMPHVVLSSDVASTAVVGKSEPKVDALRLAKGRPVFTDDIDLRHMLYAKVLRSPHAHARILAIDDSEARALPGVHAVIHYGNTPRVKYATGGQTWPNPAPWDQVSFDNKVRFVGDRVAAVAAETPGIAEEACRRIKVTYEVLPAVFDEVEAIAPGAPLVHDETDTEGIYDAAHNKSHHIEGQTVTDEVLEAAFASAKHVFQQTFHVQQQQHAPLEPHITIGWLDDDDRLVLRSSTQVPYHVRRMVAPLLGLPVKRIRVIKPRIGGGFGGKQEMLIEDIVGYLVLATRRPIRLELTRLGGVCLRQVPARHDANPAHGCRRRRPSGRPGHACRLEHRRLRHAWFYGQLRWRHARDVDIQLPGQALPVRRCLHELSRVGRLPRLWGSAELLRRRVADGRHRPRSWTWTPTSCDARTGCRSVTPSTSCPVSVSVAMSSRSHRRTCRTS